MKIDESPILYRSDMGQRPFKNSRNLEPAIRVDQTRENKSAEIVLNYEFVKSSICLKQLQIQRI